MDYPPAVLEKAQRLEQLLRRVAAGESLEEVNAALGFNLDQPQLARWQAKYEAGGRRWEALIDGRHGHPRKAHSALREWLYARKGEDEELRAPQLADEVEGKFACFCQTKTTFQYVDELAEREREDRRMERQGELVDWFKAYYDLSNP